MTWTAQATVQTVSETSPFTVTAVAYDGDMVKPHEFNTAEWVTDDIRAMELPALSSNTEGKIKSVYITFVIDADEVKLKPGDVIQATGHFG